MSTLDTLQHIHTGIEHDKHSCFPHGYFKGGISVAYTEDYLRTKCNPVGVRVGSYSDTMSQFLMGK